MAIKGASELRLCAEGSAGDPRIDGISGLQKDRILTARPNECSGAYKCRKRRPYVDKISINGPLYDHPHYRVPLIRGVEACKTGGKAENAGLVFGVAHCGGPQDPVKNRRLRAPCARTGYEAVSGDDEHPCSLRSIPFGDTHSGKKQI
eukprot:XP_001705773.1 Hypothetical protein GL50803_37366 [Giardia lamblia ATCC 50803]